MRIGLIVSCVMGAAMLAAPLSPRAAESPRPGAVDPRIQSIEYDPDQVVELRAAMGNQLMLEFGPGEKLENVAIGDSLAWQVTPNKRADLLFIKPLDPKSVTNMTVVTTLRRYVFEMRVLAKRKGVRAPVAPYLVRFVYPAPAIAIALPPEPEKPPQVVNSNYEVTGSAQNRPLRVFDDGHMIYFQWPAESAVPAIFAVGADKSESLVNYVVRGPYTVVEQLGERFVLRNGKQVTTIINRGYAPQVAGNAR
jgi:type IV secretion system protein VirB9